MSSDSLAGRAGGVAYVLRKFPVLSETFVLSEMLALEAHGVPVHVLTLAPPTVARFHDDLPKLKAAITYVAGFGELGKLLRYNWAAARRFRGRYFRTLAYVLSRGRPSLVWRFLQAGYVAHKARQLKVGHLHAHFANRATTVACLASRISGIPYSFTAHAVDIFARRVNPKVLARKLTEARFVVTVSEFNRAFLTERLGGARGRIERIYNGIDLARFAPNGGAPPPFTILAVARLVEKKGLPVLIEACRRLRDRGRTFQCRIAGMGNLYGRLAALIAEFRLDDRVRLLGALTQQEVLEHYQSAHVFALPCQVGADGNRDGLPVSIVEALACGLPVVATPVTGIPEVVRDRHNGLLVPEGDAVALAGALESLMRDADLLARLRANAQGSVAGAFDRRHTAAALKSLLMERSGAAA